MCILATLLQPQTLSHTVFVALSLSPAISYKVIVMVIVVLWTTIHLLLAFRCFCNFIYSPVLLLFEAPWHKRCTMRHGIAAWAPETFGILLNLYNVNCGLSYAPEACYTKFKRHNGIYLAHLSAERFCNLAWNCWAVRLVEITNFVFSCQLSRHCFASLLCNFGAMLPRLFPGHALTLLLQHTPDK